MRFLSLLLALPVLFCAVAHADTRLLRFPDIHGDQVVFTHGGDLWLASASGGDARRLTSHPGLELFGKFSPDGSQIAFTAQYGGDEQVYVISVNGGQPRQLTHYPAQGPLPARWGYDHQVHGWTPDGSAVLFRSLRDGHALTGSRLYTVPVDGGLPHALAMPVAGAGALSPDGKRIVYSPLTRDFRTWKRHEGGWAQDLHIFELDGSSSRNITRHVRTDRDPMWIGASIYFVSDRDDFLNLYTFNPATNSTTQLTRHVDSDARWASDDGRGRIVYELDGGLRILDVGTGADSAITVNVMADSTRERPETIKVDKYIEHFDASPNAKRVAIVARGEVFSVPVKNGVTRNLTATPGAHEREVAWSPDGLHLAYISDATGEEELYTVDHLGREAPVQLSEDSSIRYYRPLWSADNRRIAFGDSEGRIHVADVERKRVVLAGEDGGFPSHDYSWSPDGRWLVYSAAEANGYRSLHIWDANSGKTRRVTSEMFTEYEPVFSPDGNYLYYISDRSFAPQIGAIEWNYALDREAGLYAMVLKADGPHPFPLRNDEAVANKEDDSDEKKDEDDKDNDIEVSIDFDGLAQRVVRVPMEADNLQGLSVTANHILYVKTPAFYYGRDGGSKPELMALAFEDRESFSIAEGVEGYALSSDGEQVIVHSADGFKRHSVKKGNDEPDTVSVSQLETQRVKSSEWQAMFDEAWRRFRDHFYVQNMHGYDWDGLREKYRPLVNHVAHRSDLNFVLGDMVAELNVGHAYIAGGDLGLPDRPGTALLGARFAADKDGRLRFTEIFDGEAEEPKYRAPLSEVGTGVKVGDYLIAINGRRLSANGNPYALLTGAADGLVELTVSKYANGRDARVVLVKPITSESSLNYLAWVNENRARVTKATNGKVGYLHVPDMGPNGLYEFIKWYYGQIRKEGLVVDVRGNGGGNVSQMLINRLDRSLMFVTYPRGAEIPSTYPSAVFTGPLVGLLNEDSASDGDIFPAAFKARGLGPLIGKRSWGGVIGITGLGPLLDGGQVFVPQFGLTSADGQWTIEGRGVEPDIEVDNPPEAVLRGEDPQLERAIAEVERLMATQPAALPAKPAPPVKTPRAR